MNTDLKENVISSASRPEFECIPIDAISIGDVERPLSFVERVVNNEGVQRLAILLVLIVVWELYARWLNNPLLFPTFTDTLRVFLGDIGNGVLIDRALTSLRTLALGYSIGLALAALLTTSAVATTVGTRILSTLTAMFNPLPAIALLPLALIWFGLGTPSLVFVIGVVVCGAQYPERISQCAGNAAHERPQCRPQRRTVCRIHSDSGGFSLDPLRPEDRLGLRLAHTGRGGTGIRGFLAFGRHRLVHLRGTQRPRYRDGVLRIVHRHPDRTAYRIGDLPRHRGADGQSVGHAAMMFGSLFDGRKTPRRSQKVLPVGRVGA
jgi:hypothetical protein